VLTTKDETQFNTATQLSETLWTYENSQWRRIDCLQSMNLKMHSRQKTIEKEKTRVEKKGKKISERNITGEPQLDATQSCSRCACLLVCVVGDFVNEMDFCRIYILCRNTRLQFTIFKTRH